MRFFNCLKLAAGVGGLLLAVAPPSEARTRKGEKFLKEGQIAESKRNFDLALELYEKAVGEDPLDAAYQLAVRRVRFQAGQVRVEAGLKLREQGDLEGAAREFRKAYAIDPSSAIAASELKRTLAAIEAARRQAGEQAQADVNDARKNLEARLQSMLPIPELKPLNRRISTLKMNNQPAKVLFDTLGKIAGLNVIWDPEYQSTGKNYSIDLTNSTLDQALEHLSVLTKTYWKPISPNTIFLTNDNVTKRRDHEDMVVKTYYLKNLTTPQELQEIATILRTMTDIRRVFPYASQNVLMVRGEVDKVALADKIIADLDKPKGEVVIDVIVMEANRSRTRDLAATFVSGGQNGLRLPVSFAPRTELGTVGGSSTSSTSDTTTTTSTSTSTATAGAVRLSRLGDIRAEDFAVAIPNALLQALMSDRGTRVLQSPQIRATHAAKSSLKIGDRYPYATGSFQPGVGAIGVSPLVSTQFQFADVGVNVDIEPTVHGADEVTMKIEIDISNIRDRIDVGGLAQPVIGQRKFSHVVRLRSGEVSILGGLRQDQDTRSVSGTPGVGNLPVLRRIFSGESIEKSQGELLIALVPHVVRVPEITDLNLRGIAAGTDATVKLSYASKPDPGPEPSAEKPVPEPPKTAAPPVPGAAPAPPGPPPGLQPVPIVGIPGLPAAPAGVRPPAPRLQFSPGVSAVKLSGAVTASIEASSVSDLAAAPLRIKWDPKVLRLTEVTRGSLLDQGGQQAIFTRNIRNDEGEASIVLNRTPGTPGASGSGPLVNLVFQAVGKGSTQVTVLDLQLKDSRQQPIETAAPVWTVNVE